MFHEWLLKARDSIPAKIEEGLTPKRMFVLCMSTNTFADSTQFESQTFRCRDPLNKQRRLFALRLDGPQWRAFLRDYCTERYRAPD